MNFAGAFTRFRAETHSLLPLTERAKTIDPLTRHLDYSRTNLRTEYPLTVHRI